MPPSRSLNVKITGETTPSFTRAMASADKSADSLNLRIGAVSGSVAKMVPTLAAAVPALTAVSGAAAAVGSSMAAAAGGAGALGAGLAASLAPVLVVSKQVTSRFDAIKESYAAVIKAQQDGTAESKKAADEMMKHLSANERAMVGSLGRLGALQKSVLGGASDRVFGGLSKAIDALAPKLEGLAKPFARLGGAMGDAIERVGKILSSGPWQDAFTKFVDSATKIVGPITSIFVHIGGIIRDIAVAALPQVQSALKGVADWFGEIDKKATSSKIRGVIDQLIEHTKSWFGLFKEVGILLGQVLGSGADKGKGLVDTLTGVVHAVNGFIDGMQKGTGAGGNFVDTLKDGFAKVKSVAEAVWPVLKAIGGFAADAFSTVKGAIEAVWPTIRRLAVDGFGGLKKGVEVAVPAVVDAFNAIKDVVSSALQFVSRWIDKHRDDIEAFANAWKNIGKAVAVAVGVMVAAIKLHIEHVLIPVMKVALSVVKTVWPSIQKIIEGALQAIGGLIDIFSGLFTGDFRRMWNGIKDLFRGQMKALVGLLEGATKGLLKAAVGLGEVIVDGIGDGLSGIGHFVADKIGDGISWAVKNLPGAALDALKSLGGKIVGALVPGGGDGIGKKLLSGAGDGLGVLPKIGGFSGGLHGAQSGMAPFAKIAGGFGLGVSSGRSDHSKYTASGNLSYHGSGEALDFSNGYETPQEMAFARYMASQYGGRLAELIYTPLGFSIKDGRRVAPIAASDHHDHVHVAFDLGKRGVGDGIGQIRSLWTKDGGDPSKANMAAAIAMAESGGNPNISHRNSDGSIDRGLWQINSVHGALSTFNRDGNARAAIKISGNGRNWNPWTVFKTGAYKRFLTGSGGLSSAKPIDTHTIHSSGSAPKMDNSAIYADSTVDDSVSAATGFANAQQNPTGPRKGGGPRKGNTPEQNDALGAAREALANVTDPHEKQILANIALSALDNTDDPASLANDLLYNSELRDVRKGKLAAAIASGDSDRIITAAGDLQSSNDAVKALTEALNKSTDMQQRLIDLQTESNERGKRIEALASNANVFQSQFISWLSSAMGGPVGLGFQAAGTPGQMARY